MENEREYEFTTYRGMDAVPYTTVKKESELTQADIDLLTGDAIKVFNDLPVLAKDKVLAYITLYCVMKYNYERIHDTTQDSASTS